MWDYQAFFFSESCFYAEVLLELLCTGLFGQGSIKMHLQRSPLLYADMHPVHKTDVVTGFNQILLETSWVQIHYIKWS